MLAILLAALIAAAAGQDHGQGHNQNHGHSGEIHANQHAIEEQIKHAFLRFDSDHDGEISLEESLASFDNYDTNGDGCLDWSEFLESRRDGQHGPVHPTEEQYRFLFNLEDTLMGSAEADNCIARDDSNYFFSLMDVNGDGSATVAELEDAMQQNFRTYISSTLSTPAP